MKILRFITFLSFTLITSHLFGQTKSIDIWQGKVPGAIENPSFTLIYDSTVNVPFMRQVTTPLLDMYLAPLEIANGTAVIICPGGGYWGLAYKHEGSQIAAWFNSIGISAFVLKYRLPNNTIMKDKSIGPMQDGQKSIRLVRQNAKAWNIDPNKIGIMGFSAGGHLASTLSTHFLEKVYEDKDNTSARPDFSLLIYPVISMDSSITHMGSRNYLLGEKPSQEQVARFSNELQVTAQTPPAFLVQSLDDGVVPVQNSINYALAMKNHHIPCELHLYESGGHGYGMGHSSNTESTWPEACMKWLSVKGFLKN